MDSIKSNEITTNSKAKIIKSGFLQKRSKYLKIWKRYFKFNFSRFVVLTNKNIFAFVNNDKEADCTMNLLLSSLGRVRYADEELGKEFTFVSCYFILRL
jgi:hypothetical protein